LFFLADDGEHGKELWKTDGSAGGTTLVADLTAGPSSTTDIGWMAPADGALWFFREGWTGESGLWRSDSTGTFEVGSFESSFSGGGWAVGGIVYFTLSPNGGGPTALWRI